MNVSVVVAKQEKYFADSTSKLQWIDTNFKVMIKVKLLR